MYDNLCDDSASRHFQIDQELACSSWVYNIWNSYRNGLHNTSEFYEAFEVSIFLISIFPSGWTIHTFPCRRLWCNICCVYISNNTNRNILLHLWCGKNVQKHRIHDRILSEYILEGLLVVHNTSNNAGDCDLYTYVLRASNRWRLCFSFLGPRSWVEFIICRLCSSTNFRIP